ncbi:MAG TPA: glycosyltransferase family 4 protein [Beijerinckiaceae bacterium]|jgi:glycosyltransferase involved in cell wall biosynthesis|nr:glycosyltransferase family 4 protein [Beijerinckiaceae bacterium]
MDLHSEPGRALDVVIVLDHAHVSGGQAKVAIDSALGLKRRGHNPTVFAAVGPVDCRLTEAGISVVCLGQNDLLGQSRLAAAGQGLWNAAAAKALEALLSRYRDADAIVHVHGWAKALSPAIAMPIRASGLPRLYTMHEYFLLCPNGGFYDYRAAESCRRKPLSLGCLSTNCDSRHYVHKLWRSARQVVARDIAHLPNLFGDIVTLSTLSAEVLQPFIGSSVRLHHVPNPVDAVDLGRKLEPASGDMIFVGRLSAEKGTMIYAEAARRAGLVPVFIGDGPLESELRTRYPQAKLLGWHSFEDVRAAMRSARALVFPSVWYETFGLTVYEALACGTPVVVSDACAGREGVVDGRNGLRFRTGDIDDLAEKLVALRDDGLVTRLSRAAYDDYWANPLTLDRHIDALCRIYATLVGKVPVKRRSAEHARAASSPVVVSTIRD